MNKTIDNLNIIHAIKTHILSDNNLNKKFNHFNQKYSLDELLLREIYFNDSYKWNII